MTLTQPAQVIAQPLGLPVAASQLAQTPPSAMAVSIASLVSAQ